MDSYDSDDSSNRFPEDFRSLKQLVKDIPSDRFNFESWAMVVAHFSPYFAAFVLERFSQVLHSAVDPTEATRATIGAVWRSYLCGLVELDSGSPLVSIVLNRSRRQFIDFYRRWQAGLETETLALEFSLVLTKARSTQLSHELSTREIATGFRVLKLTERRILYLRVRDYDWTTIGRVVGLTAQNACDRFRQALNRIRTLHES